MHNFNRCLLSSIVNNKNIKITLSYIKITSKILNIFLGGIFGKRTELLGRHFAEFLIGLPKQFASRQKLHNFDRKVRQNETHVVKNNFRSVFWNFLSRKYYVRQKFWHIFWQNKSPSKISVNKLFYVETITSNL